MATSRNNCWLALSLPDKPIGMKTKNQAHIIYGKFNNTPLWVVRKTKQRGKTFKYVYMRSAKQLLKHIPQAVNSLLENKLKLWYTDLWFENVLLSFCIFSGCI